SAAVSTDAQNRTVVTLSFSGSETDPVSALNGGVASLADGRYQLTILSSQVSAGGVALAGGGANGNYVSPSDTFGGSGLHLYRLYGDVSGDGVVDATDLGLFRLGFNSSTGNAGYLWYLDADNSGSIDASDLGQFRTRYNLNVF
ncbi:MAG TPA: dockerin type I domain-containing protein, partial [Gemmataceae bacterium]|nr:dockerin type I domain-containing protein [Gemmataceae bacterium]